MIENNPKKKVMEAGHQRWTMREWIRAFSVVVLVLDLASVYDVCVHYSFLFPEGHSWRPDFMTFWISLKMAVAGHLDLSYIPDEIYAVYLHTIHPVDNDRINFNVYPPAFYLLIFPLVFFPVRVAYGLFVTMTFVTYARTLRHILPWRDLFWPLLAYPAVWLTLIQGQNAFLTATLAATALLSMENNQKKMAGFWMGLLVVKPQLVVAIFFALWVRREFQTLGIALLTGAGLMGGALLFGDSAMINWMSSLKLNASVIKDNPALLQFVPTTFSFMRLSGASAVVSGLVQGGVGIVALMTLRSILIMTTSWALAGAAIMVTSFLILPYVGFYDFAWLAFPLAWMTSRGLKRGWLPGELWGLGATWFLPFCFYLVSRHSNIPFAPLTLMALLFLIWRRCHEERKLTGFGT